MPQQISLAARYDQTIDFLYSRLPMFERVGPIAFKKDLTNILALCEILGQPQKKFKSIHIAGTNGKGSVSHMLSSVLIEAGYKTGLYISPHYKDYRERIRVNGHYISKKQVVSFVDQIAPHIDAIRPSFFEITVAMAFDHFANQKIDIAVVETGLGGRLDSTNILSPILSIITNISYDHQNMLGNALTDIAFEKAGIIKAGVPVLIGEYQQKVFSVFKNAAVKRNSDLRVASRLGKVMTQATTNRYVYKPLDGKYLKLDMPYHGAYQTKNILTVIQATQLLHRQGMCIISQSDLKRGLKNVDTHAPLVGRWQSLCDAPKIIADAGHNVDGIRAAINELRMIRARQIHIIFGTVKDKDVLPVLQLLPKSAQYYFVKADIPRAMDDQELYEKALGLGLKGQACGTVKKGFQKAKSLAGINDLILVTGSIFVVAEVL